MNLEISLPLKFVRLRKIAVTVDALRPAADPGTYAYGAGSSTESVPVEYWITGWLLRAPAVGEPIRILRTARNGVTCPGYFESSEIKAIPQLDRIQTVNSIYQWEVIAGTPIFERPRAPFRAQIPKVLSLSIMSTKSTIACGPKFHLYRDLAGPSGHIWLELRNVGEIDFERASLRLSIPVAIWEAVRRHPGVDLSLANLSSREIRELAVKRTEEYIAHRLEWLKMVRLARKKRQKSWAKHLLNLWYRSGNRNEAFENILRDLKHSRSAQRKFVRQITRAETWPAGTPNVGARARLEAQKTATRGAFRKRTL